jgi:hypothetical protein
MLLKQAKKAQSAGSSAQQYLNDNTENQRH